MIINEDLYSYYTPFTHLCQHLSYSSQFQPLQLLLINNIRSYQILPPITIHQSSIKYSFLFSFNHVPTLFQITVIFILVCHFNFTIFLFIDYIFHTFFNYHSYIFFYFIIFIVTLYTHNLLVHANFLISLLIFNITIS